MDRRDRQRRRHLYFRAPTSGGPWRNTAGRIGWHIDTRAAGGYVVADGSVVDGRPYVAWSSTAPTSCPSGSPTSSRPRPHSQRPALQLPRHPRVGATPPQRSTARYARVLDAPIGQRNAALNRAALEPRTARRLRAHRPGGRRERRSRPPAIAVGGQTPAGVAATIRSAIDARLRQGRREAGTTLAPCASLPRSRLAWSGCVLTVCPAGVTMFGPIRTLRWSRCGARGRRPDLVGARRGAPPVRRRPDWPARRRAQPATRHNEPTPRLRPGARHGRRPLRRRVRARGPNRRAAVTRGASWLDQVAARVAADHGRGTPADKQARALARDPYLWSHPERSAQARAHKARARGACSSDCDPAAMRDCPCDPDELAAIWAGVTRMASARLAAADRSTTSIARPSIARQPRSRPEMTDPTPAPENEPGRGPDDPDLEHPLTADDIVNHARRPPATDAAEATRRRARLVAARPRALPAAARRRRAPLRDRPRWPGDRLCGCGAEMACAPRLARLYFDIHASDRRAASALDRRLGGPRRSGRPCRPRARRPAGRGRRRGGDRARPGHHRTAAACSSTAAAGAWWSGRRCCSGARRSRRRCPSPIRGGSLDPLRRAAQRRRGAASASSSAGSSPPSCLTSRTRSSPWSASKARPRAPPPGWSCPSSTRRRRRCAHRHARCARGRPPHRRRGSWLSTTCRRSRRGSPTRCARPSPATGSSSGRCTPTTTSTSSPSAAASP